MEKSKPNAFPVVGGGGGVGLGGGGGGAVMGRVGGGWRVSVEFDGLNGKFNPLFRC